MVTGDKFILRLGIFISGQLYNRSQVHLFKERIKLNNSKIIHKERCEQDKQPGTNIAEKKKCDKYM